MADFGPTTDATDDAGAPFRELRGDYVENTGQVINLREYLDYFEPLGSALSRQPDATGGPFIHHFTPGGGRTIGSLGWVVSAASKRFGGWKLWGLWSGRTIPAIALPLYWPLLSDPSRVSELVDRANDDARLLLEPRRWPELFKKMPAKRLRDDEFRDSLKAELARAWAVPLPHRHPIEVELTPGTLELLPWLYLLGPVDPATAQLQPSRFNGPGYQYFLGEQHLPLHGDAKIPAEIDNLVDEAESNVLSASETAKELRERRGRPKRPEPPPSRTPKRRSTSHSDDFPRETTTMPSGSSTTPPSRARAATKPKPSAEAPVWADETPSLAQTIWTPIWQVAVLALLAWIAWNVHLMRKATVASPGDAPAVSSTASSSDIEPEPDAGAAPVTETTTREPEPDLSRARLRRITTALAAKPPRGVRLSTATLDDIARGGTGAPDKLARVAIEVFLRRNGCLTTTDPIDARLTTTESRAIPRCRALEEAALMATATEPNTAKAINWLERTVGATN
ncbi:MAG TPA: hypothetical protein VGF69_14510 [Thermoanaerobaculia bacterium]|jgi:hypothetical protein